MQFPSLWNIDHVVRDHGQKAKEDLIQIVINIGGCLKPTRAHSTSANTVTRKLLSSSVYQSEQLVWEIRVFRRLVWSE
jgi:hypothetical protein